MYAYKIANGRYVAETIGANPEGDYLSDTQIDCTLYQPDETGAPVLIPLPEPEPEPVVPTPEEIAAQTKQQLIWTVQNHLDTYTRQYGYDDIKSAVTYADEPAVPKFQSEGRTFRAWRSLVWAACYAILADVLAGTRPVPTVDELLAELPGLEAE